MSERVTMKNAEKKLVSFIFLASECEILFSIAAEANEIEHEQNGDQIATVQSVKRN